jgi:hypothetical protein
VVFTGAVTCGCWGANLTGFDPDEHAAVARDNAAVTAIAERAALDPAIETCFRFRVLDVVIVVRERLTYRTYSSPLDIPQTTDDQA